MVETSRPLQVFCDWLVNRVAGCGRRVLNATGGGIFAGPGIEQTTLRAAIGGGPVLPAPQWSPAVTTSTPLETLAAAVADIRDAVESHDEAHPLVRAWTTFSGGAFDTASVRDALARAEAGLRGEAAGSRGLPSLPWAALSDAGLPLSWFPGLPAHLAAAAAGAVVPDGTAVRRASWLLAPLVQALDSGAADLDAVSAADVTASALAPALRPWPPLVAWPLRLFDALVPATADGATSFFAPPAPARSPASPAAPLAAVARAVAAQVSARWMRAAAGASSAAPAARVRGVAALLETESDAPGGGLGPELLVSLTCAGAPAVHLSRRATGDDWPRVLTGCLRLHSGAPAPPARLASFADHGVRIEVDVSGAAAVVTPRVLTAEGLAPGAAAHAAAGGVVVAALHRHTSAWIGEDGAVRQYSSWPRTIVGQLPMGEGAVAWSNGTGAWPELGAGYVMYRERLEGPVTVEALPFRPTAGAWLDGHLYWNTFPRGVGRWRPGTPGDVFLPDESFCGLIADGAALALAPATRDAEGRALRRVHTTGSRLVAGGGHEQVALPADGASTSRAVGPDGWTATAFPDVDLVALERNGRRVDLTCHHPMTVAWAGRSLVTCTAPGDVLLFERLADTLALLA